MRGGLEYVFCDLSQRYVRGSLRSEYLLLDLVNEVEFDALSWHLEHRGGLAVVFVKL